MACVLLGLTDRKGILKRWQLDCRKGLCSDKPIWEKLIKRQPNLISRLKNGSVGIKLCFVGFIKWWVYRNTLAMIFLHKALGSRGVPVARSIRRPAGPCTNDTPWLYGDNLGAVRCCVRRKGSNLNGQDFF